MSQRNVDDDLDWDYAWSKFQELEKANAKLKRYERVIEAAKAWAHSARGGERLVTADVLLAMLEALEKEKP